jgi:CubicO group peptidase (beta-lactamase class C family)
MTTRNLLASIPVLLLAAACGSDEDPPSAQGAPGGSAGQGGSAGVAGAGGGAGQPSCVGTQSTDDKLSRALDVLRAELAKGRIPGGAIAIVKDGRLVDLGVTGSKRASGCDPVTPDTLFRTASLTHWLTSIAVLDAEEDGKLSRTAPIQDLMPLRVSNSTLGNPDEITLQHLLTYSSMYAPEWNDGPASVGSDCWPSIAEAFANAKNPVMYGKPGSMYHGLWSDMELAGLALETAEKKPFADVVAERVLRPLGMGGAFETAKVLANDHALGSDGSLPDCPNRYPSEHYHGSIRDVAKLAEHQTGGAAQILDAPQRDAMLSEQGPNLNPFVRNTYGGVVYRAESIGDQEVNLSSWGWGFAQDVTIWRNRRLAVVTLVNPWLPGPVCSVEHELRGRKDLRPEPRRERVVVQNP